MRAKLNDQMLSALSGLLAQQTGLNFPEERWGDLERGLQAAARESGASDVQAYVGQLLSSPLTPHQTEVLASHLTVGETYFFRDNNSFAALEQQVLPQLIAARRATGCRLRIWCAGCCTGEEPYSIATLLDRLLPAHEQWHITLLATDINPHFLRKAAQGSYGEWSFRDTPAWVKQRYFTSGREGRFEILPRIKQKVTFSCLNLADDVYPSLSNNTHAMDLILCRNVLMYLTAPQAAKIAANLQRALVADGWLLPSAVEASNTLFDQCAPVNICGAAFYRKATAEAKQAALADYPAPVFAMASTQARVLPATTEELPIPASVAWPVPEHAVTQPEPQTHQPPLVAQTDKVDDLCATARLCANQGRLGEAADWCRQAIAADKLNPHSHYLLATILQELGQENAAEQSLKRALYLAPEFVLAFFTLGNLYLTRGRYAEARRNFSNALALLQQHLPDETVAEADGLTVWRLHKIIQSVLDSTPSAAAMHHKKGVSHATGSSY